MRRLVFAFVLFLLSLSAAAQQVQQSGWVASFNTFRLSPNWSLHFDAQLRSTDDLKQVQSIILRPGINYHINKAWTATAGYAFIPNRRTIGGMSELFTEHRTWQQLAYSHKISAATTVHRLRFEQRFTPAVAFDFGDISKGGHNQAYRLRYFIRNVLPLKQQPSFTGGPFFALQNEVFLNTGDKSAVNGRLFDQNRLYLAFGYRLPRTKLDLEAGYLNQYIEGRGRVVTNNHVAQIALYKRL